MRVYERKIDFDFDYPNDMKMILDYLNEHGEILVGELGIESLYYEFSNEKYEAGFPALFPFIIAGWDKKSKKLH